MKKIFLIIASMFALAACVREDMPSVKYPAVGDDEVLIEASIVVPEMQDTRSFAAPAITSLHLLVFDENGYLIEADKAVAVNAFGVEKDKEYTFKVKLGQSNYKRTIHLVANSPVAINDDGTTGYMIGEHERRVINTLSTAGGADAYWAQVILEDGIIGEQKTSANGQQVFEPSVELKAMLTRVPMVRNFTRVSLTNNASDYIKDVEIMMMNIPDKGSVAPLISDGRYASFAERSQNREYSYDDISAQGYEGYEPNDMALMNSNWGTRIDFYERHQQSGGRVVATPAFAIVRGHYEGSTATDIDYSYYKIDLCYQNTSTGATELYNLFRNIEYNIIITGASGRGYATAEEAAMGAAANNLNFAVETKSLNNISDGERRLSVEYTQRVLTQGDALFTLKYRYEADIATGDIDNDAVSFSNLAGNVLAVNNAAGATDVEKYIVSKSTGADGWNTVTFKTQAISGTKLQTIILTAENLQRSVEFILGSPYTMVLDMVPDSDTNIVERKVGASVAAKISLPLGLPEALFPLQIYLVAEELSLSPDAAKNVLPVITDLNSNGVPSSEGTHFGYVITIEADYYYMKDTDGKRSGEYNNEVTLFFKTSTADSSSVVNIYNPYFEIASDSFTAQAAGR